MEVLKIRYKFLIKINTTKKRIVKNPNVKLSYKYRNNFSNNNPVMISITNYNHCGQYKLSNQ